MKYHWSCEFRTPRGPMQDLIDIRLGRFLYNGTLEGNVDYWFVLGLFGFSFVVSVEKY